MAKTMDLLKAEHETMRKLLDILEEQVSLIEEGRETDKYLIGEITDYFRRFPDMYHHPKEDLIFEALEQRSPDTVNKMGDLESKHEELSQELHEFTRTVVKYLLNRDRWKSHFLVRAKKFVTDERAHIDSEETYFFPIALQTLSQEDWDNIDNQVGVFTNPLKTEAEAGCFTEIMKHLEKTV
ncbi:MAG: hemerythrin domain-containing protein [Methyloligellaceae bacterium]